MKEEQGPVGYLMAPGEPTASQGTVGIWWHQGNRPPKRSLGLCLHTTSTLWEALDNFNPLAGPEYSLLIFPFFVSTLNTTF